VLTLGFGQMFAFLSSIHQVYAEIFGREESFPAVVRADRDPVGGGHRAERHAGHAARDAAARHRGLRGADDHRGRDPLGELTGLLPPALAFPVFLFWSVSIFFMAGLVFGNLNALALQPMGHIAGMAASVVGRFPPSCRWRSRRPSGLPSTARSCRSRRAFLCSALAWWLMRKSREADPEPKRFVPN
jgi:MFS transporter, DHA1 family, multidrug resistance protein